MERTLRLVPAADVLAHEDIASPGRANPEGGRTRLAVVGGAGQDDRVLPGRARLVDVPIEDRPVPHRDRHAAVD